MKLCRLPNNSLYYYGIIYQLCVASFTSAMYSLRRRVLSQNFLKSRKLVDELVGRSSIGKNDTVLEIGTGKGIITEKLLQVADKVIAVELDTQLYFCLKSKFAAQGTRLQLINKDFLQYKLPTFPYKVFANVPFSIEGKIVRQLLNAPNPPEDTYVVVREDLAERLIGKYKECQFSVFYKLWFTFEIVHRFNKYDYEPAATMETVLLRFTKRKTPVLPPQEKIPYMQFIGQGFRRGKLLKYNLNYVFSHTQFKRLAKDIGFDIKSKPSDLSLEQWIKLFTFAKSIGKVVNTP